MERFRDCSLCSVEPKAEAFRCRFCSGKLTGRDRLLQEINGTRRVRRLGSLLSAVAPGLGQAYQNRLLTGLAFATLIPLCLGLVYVTFKEFSYSHLFILGAALYVLIVAVADAWFGVTEPRPPCQKTCPANVPIPDYLQLIIDEQYEDGIGFVMTRVPFAGCIGRVCPHPCETVCYRGVDGEPIAINACKRFLADNHRQSLPQAAAPAEKPAGSPKVAVVGAGPSGLSCAYYLSILGAEVVVYDAEEKPGGRFITTIPDFRLPQDVVGGEVEELRRRGVVFRTGTRVGPGGVPFSELFAQHDAVYLAIGAPESLQLKVEGADAFLDFQDILREAKTQTPMAFSGPVAVVGGGNAAIDVSRTALRCGAERVDLLYRRDREQMPARDDEVEAAMREGVHFHYLVNPVRAVIEDGTLLGLVVVNMELGPADSGGRPQPVPVQGSERLMECSAVIPCLGQNVQSKIFDDPALKGLRRDRSGRVAAHPLTRHTSVRRLYAGGDMVRGAQTAIAAIADGRAAALSIYGDLKPGELKSFTWRNLRLRKPFAGHVETPQEKIREEMRCTPLRGRTANLAEVEEGFYGGQALREAKRCLQCHREL